MHYTPLHQQRASGDRLTIPWRHV